MNVLSLFDGISCAREALRLADIQVNKYYACEIDKYAIQISKKNWGDNIHLGSVVDFSNTTLNIDLLIGGSPCQDLSIAKKDRKGLDGNRSGLFWEYVRIKNLLKPKYFILENVASMPQKDKDIITEAMGVEPVMFNASLVSAQCRKRLFWTNIKFELPEDRDILLKDILQDDAEVDERMITKGKAFTLTTSYLKASASEKQINNSIKRKQRTMVFTKTAQTGINETKKLGFIDNIDHQANRVYDINGKLPALNSICNSRIHDTTNNIHTYTKGIIRKLTPIECERLQSLPDDYTLGISTTQRYKCLGNAFNCNVIEHILRFI